MHEEQSWEEIVEQLKESLPVDQEFKRSLRVSLLSEGKVGKGEIDHLRNERIDEANSSRGRRNKEHQCKPQGIRQSTNRNRYYWKWGLAVVTVASILFTLIWTMKEEKNQVLASSLHLFEQYSIQEQLGNEQSEGMAEYNGILYLPMKEKGLYQLKENKLTKLIEGNINYVRVSPNGEQLVYVQQDELYLYCIKDGHSELLIKQDKGLGKLSSPAWSEDGKELLFVSSVNNSNEIISINLADRQWQKITSGKSPNYVAGEEGMFFERNHEIIYLDLNTKKEKVLDIGQKPAVSNDGSYVAYIKSEGEPEVQNLWIADSNFKTKKQITSNQIMNYAFDPNTGEFMEGKQQARYTLDQPVWSNEDNRLYVYKIFHTDETWRKLTRLELSTVKLTPSDIVGNSIAALIYRDEEFAHSFFSFDPGYLKGTNPRQIGYHINDSVQRGAQTIVDADIHLSNADPYYEIDKQRYTVVDTPTGYKISALESLGWMEISDQEDGIYLTNYVPGEDNVVSSNSSKKPKEKTLLLLHDYIPQQQGWTNGAVTSLQYNEQQQHLFFTLSRTAGKDTKIVLFDYDLKKKDFKEFTIWQGNGIGQTVLLQVNEKQRYAAVNISLEHQSGDLLIVDLVSNKTVSMADYTEQDGNVLVPRYWNNDKFIFYAEEENRDIFYSYHPAEQNESH
jgi:hypothetical protein